MANRYVVTGTVTISIRTVVEAQNAEEAVGKAEETRCMTTFCNQCGGDPEIEWATSGELDGTPSDLVAEVEN